jgi:hypothetical protein
MATANLFDLPMCCQYGVGSPSFGAWRELAANAMATSWVLADHCANFPLLYHWRVLDRPASAAPVPEELVDVERAVAYWHGSPAVRRRIEAIVDSSATVALFLEYLPLALPDWLAATVSRADSAAVSAIAMVEHGLRDGVAFMNAAGLFHFDAHFGNIRTDGDRLYFADFGLATSPRFDLSATELSFLATTISHDACHTITRLVDWLVTEVAGEPYRVERDDFIRRCAGGYKPVDLLPAAVAIITRYAPIAIVINEFYRRLHLEDRNTPYPVADVERACRAAGFEGPWSG